MITIMNDKRIKSRRQILKENIDIDDDDEEGECDCESVR